jgi:hypothetical protein
VFVFLSIPSPFISSFCLVTPIGDTRFILHKRLSVKPIIIINKDVTVSPDAIGINNYKEIITEHLKFYHSLRPISFISLVLHFVALLPQNKTPFRSALPAGRQVHFVNKALI